MDALLGTGGDESAGTDADGNETGGDGNETDGSDGGGPGFGPLAALGGLAGAGYLVDRLPSAGGSE